MRAVGVDLVAVDRIAALLERHGERFLARCFHPDEAAVAARPGRAGAQALAARWAAKEACLKILGGPLEPVPYRDVEVVRDALGAPSLRLHGRALALWEARGGGALHLSLSHERDAAVAVVVLD